MSATSSTVLAVESSCDETAAAVVSSSAAGFEVRSNIVASQVEVHAKFGGVVPELASRHHLDVVAAVLDRARSEADVEWSEVDAIAVTDGPGLVGALLVGAMAARGLSVATGRPLLGVHHLEGHLCSALIGRGDLELGPHLCLLVSGGHTEIVEVAGLGRYRLVGSTRDDAVGEAFDKVAKMMGLGYPGGPVVDRLAREGNPEAIAFPRAMLDQDNFDFSFAGLKTAVSVHLQKHGQPQSRQALADICASFEAAVADVLVRKLLRARAHTDARALHVVGGAAANTALRSALENAAQRDGFELRLAPLRYCADNAAMIGVAGLLRLRAGERRPVEVRATVPLDDPRCALGLAP